MSDTQQRSSYSEDAVTSAQPEPTAWAGMVIFAGTMLLMLGALQAMEGLVAIFQDDYYLVTRNGMIVSLDYTAWGWTHLILGVLVALAGVALFSGRMWGRVVGVALALLSILTNFAFMPAYPLWAINLIIVDIFVIYAIVIHGPEMRTRA